MQWSERNLNKDNNNNKNVFSLCKSLCCEASGNYLWLFLLHQLKTEFSRDLGFLEDGFEGWVDIIQAFGFQPVFEAHVLEKGLKTEDTWSCQTTNLSEQSLASGIMNKGTWSE